MKFSGCKPLIAEYDQPLYVAPDLDLNSSGHVTSTLLLASKLEFVEVAGNVEGAFKLEISFVGGRCLGIPDYFWVGFWWSIRQFYSVFTGQHGRLDLRKYLFKRLARAKTSI